MNEPAPAVAVRELSHAYGARAVLHDVSFEVAAGEICGLLGPNGGGKSTLFRILSTLLPAGSGDATVCGASLRDEPGEVRRRIGVTFQSPALDRRLTVFENLKHHGRLYGVFGPLLRQRIQAAAERLAIADRLHDRVESLSGGLQRRAEIAKCLLHEPQLLLLDEPTAGLDPGARRSLWELLRELRRDLGMSILLATHLLDEAEFCDRLGILDRGRFAAWGTPDELRRGVGGDCVTIRSPQPELLRVAVEARFQVAVRMRGHELRIERPRGYELVREVCEAWPDLVESVTVGRPTLEDAFIQKTGHGLEEE